METMFVESRIHSSKYLYELFVPAVYIFNGVYFVVFGFCNVLFCHCVALCSQSCAHSAQ